MLRQRSHPAGPNFKCFLWRKAQCSGLRKVTGSSADECRGQQAGQRRSRGSGYSVLGQSPRRWVVPRFCGWSPCPRSALLLPTARADGGGEGSPAPSARSGMGGGRALRFRIADPPPPPRAEMPRGRRAASKAGWESVPGLSGAGAGPGRAGLGCARGCRAAAGQQRRTGTGRGGSGSAFVAAGAAAGGHVCSGGGEETPGQAQRRRGRGRSRAREEPAPAGGGGSRGGCGSGHEGAPLAASPARGRHVTKGCVVFTRRPRGAGGAAGSEPERSRNGRRRVGARLSPRAGGSLAGSPSRLPHGGGGREGTLSPEAQKLRECQEEEAPVGIGQGRSRGPCGLFPRGWS